MVPPVPFDALIVLGCRVDGGKLAHAALRRVERAAAAYRELGAEVVIASGGKAWQGHLESDVFAEGLIARGVPASRVVREVESLTTRGNARYTARLLGEHQALRLGLVTCDWHMRRALSLFRRAGLTATPLPAAAPPRPLRSVLWRGARERAASGLDWVLARSWPRP